VTKPGKYDAIVSIEMFEAVGEKYWPTYFSKVRQCLKPGGTRRAADHHHQARSL
jgi:cyclopropane fatty-acyl-phospholipid synthase-like methyltransferase